MPHATNKDPICYVPSYAHRQDCHTQSIIHNNQRDLPARVPFLSFLKGEPPRYYGQYSINQEKEGKILLLEYDIDKPTRFQSSV